MNLQDNLDTVNYCAEMSQHISWKQKLYFVSLLHPLLSWYHPLQFNHITNDKAHHIVWGKRSCFLQNKSLFHLKKSK